METKLNKLIEKLDKEEEQNNKKEEQKYYRHPTPIKEDRLITKPDGTIIKYLIRTMDMVLLLG